MTRRAWLSLLVLLPTLVGCSPDGPPEFYRSALQARSEFVDSLSRIVDEESAKEHYKRFEERYDERIKGVTSQFDDYKKITDPLFNKMKQDNFKEEWIGPGDREMLVGGIRANVRYAKEMVPTQVRLNRELARLRMVAILTILTKSRGQVAQLPANAKLEFDIDKETPALYAILDFFRKLSKNDPAMLPFVAKNTPIQKILTRGDEAQLKTDFDDLMKQQRELTGFSAPLPPYPDWADQILKSNRVRFREKP